MSISTKKPAIKETVGAQYVCFNKMDENNDFTTTFEDSVEKTEVVKSVKITENAETSNTYASGKVYDSDTATSTIDIETEVIAFPDDTLAKMRGDNVNEGGLILSGGNRVRPFFAYGKVVKLKGGKVRYDWYPKCKLSENSDDTSTKEDKASEQTDTIKITAYPFNSDGDIVAKVSSDVNFPENLTEDKFFGQVIMTQADLTKVTTP
ncbi:major tail protein [Roseburia sp. 831b]|uniref:major tail protein n=1 Tax=Roseburia sp. 831b TaxID=1261635 RepID=UPI000951FEFD|nr:major tail protein [Roseburia sp. 831b]WVK73804.1 phage tail protein [Roseburia sp. 831b]